MKTFLDFITGLRAEIWPAGEANTLKAVHTQYFRAAMIDLQKWVPCLASHNTTQYPFCGTYWEDAKTVFDQPNGIIRRLFTVANDDWRDKVHLWSSNFHEIECWAKALWDADTPATESIQQGFYNASKNTDTKFERARTGIWAINRRRVYVAPYIQSNEIVVVEWDGVNQVWADTDGVNTAWWTIDVQEAIKWYVKWQHEYNFSDVALGRQCEAMYKEKLSDLIWECREKTKQQENDPTCPGQNQNQFLQTDEITDDEVPTVSSEFENCFVADFGVLGTPLDDVAGIINGLAPKNLILGGDTTYDGADPEAILAKFTTPEKKWFVPGNHDWDHDSTLQVFKDIYDYNGSNGRYYTFVDGPVQYFIISTDPREEDVTYTDANTLITGPMVDWLSAMLALSTARWKIVIGHHAPYTSDENNTPGNRWIRLNYKAMGADAYIGGHAHNAEEIRVSDFPYITCGLGGASIRNFGAATDGTIVNQYNSDFSFLKLRATCSSFKAILTDRTGAEVYTTELTKS
jgi:hypothetical protein